MAEEQSGRMPLRKFVRDVLLEVTNGVELAQEEANKKTTDRQYGNTVIVPSSSKGDREKAYVEFDVEVTVERMSGTGGGASVKAWSFVDIGGSRETGSSHASSSRLRFRVPVQFRDGGRQ